jgi:hypothetical protein
LAAEALGKLGPKAPPTVTDALAEALGDEEPSVRTAAAAALALSARGSGAQGGRHAAVLLELPASARALALGNAGAALAGDDAALFYNPAQLALAGGASAGLSVQRYLAASTLAAVSGATRLGPGVVALGVQTLDYGSEDEVVPDPAYGGERGIATGASVSANDFAATVGYAAHLARLRVGAAAKLVRQRVADQSGSTVAGDFGAALDVGAGATLSLALQNVGGDLTVGASRGALPTALRLGAAVPLPSVGGLDVLATAEAAQVRDGGFDAGGGAEVTWRGTGGLSLVGRVGALPRSGADVSRFTFGGGIAAKHLALDYAYQGFETVGGSTHRVGVRWWR